MSTAHAHKKHKELRQQALGNEAARRSAFDRQMASLRRSMQLRGVIGADTMPPDELVARAVAYLDENACEIEKDTK